MFVEAGMTPVNALRAATLDGARVLERTENPSYGSIQAGKIADIVVLNADPIADIITPSKRVMAVQRTLTEFGYGQLRPTGNFDRDTQEAIAQFERARKLPVTRQITPVLIRELSAMAGRPIE